MSLVKVGRSFIYSALLVAFWFPASNLQVTGQSLAQESAPKGPVYVVQAGDTIWDIAQSFRVSMEELMSINGITNPGQLSEGAQLVIPGLDGIEGVLTTKTIPYGETLFSLSKRYGIPKETLSQLNHVISPAELYAGATLIIPQSNAEIPAVRREILRSGQSILELAVLRDVNPWDFLTINALETTWEASPGEILLLPGVGGKADVPGGLPEGVDQVKISPLPFLQGKVSVLNVKAQEGTSLNGVFMGHNLHFFGEAGELIALQGVHAMTEPGVYPLVITGTLADQTPFSFSQMVGVGSVDYPYDKPLTVDPATIDPAVTKPEEAEWSALASQATPVRYWSGAFLMPSPLPQDYCLETGDCWSSRFGNRRSYNGSSYEYFHTGLDVVGGTGTEIYAPAAGIVVFAGPLTVRGNATMIDHGWGVYTGYMHQSEIIVKVGDRVEPGQLIGLVGGTGRVEGPHLHLEVWVGGVQVDPLDWLSQAYP